MEYLVGSTARLGNVLVLGMLVQLKEVRLQIGIIKNEGNSAFNTAIGNKKKSVERENLTVWILLQGETVHYWSCLRLPITTVGSQLGAHICSSDNSRCVYQNSHLL